MVHLRRGSLPQLSNINSEWKCHQHLSFKLCWIHYTADFIAPSAELEGRNCVKHSVVVPGGSHCSRSRRVPAVPAVPCVAGEPGRCCQGAQGTAVCELCPWAHTRAGKRLRLCFLKLPVRYLELDCSGWGFWPGEEWQNLVISPVSTGAQPCHLGHREQLCPSQKWLEGGSFSFPLCSPKQEQLSTSQGSRTGTDWSEQERLKLISFASSPGAGGEGRLTNKPCFRQAENFSVLVWL